MAARSNWVIISIRSMVSSASHSPSRRCVFVPKRIGFISMAMLMAKVIARLTMNAVGAESALKNQPAAQQSCGIPGRHGLVRWQIFLMLTSPACCVWKPRTRLMRLSNSCPVPATRCPYASSLLPTNCPVDWPFNCHRRRCALQSQLFLPAYRQPAPLARRHVAANLTRVQSSHTTPRPFALCRRCWLRTR